MLGGAIFVCLDWLNLALERERPFASALRGEDSLSKMTRARFVTNFPREYGISKGSFDELVNGNSLPGAVRGGT